MSTDSRPHRGYHDLGGLEGAQVDRAEHVMQPWEKRVDALRVLLGDSRRNIMRADVLRNAIETMGEDLYDELSYYERWMAAIIKVLTEREVLSRADIDARMAAITERLGLAHVEERPLPRAE